MKHHTIEHGGSIFRLPSTITRKSVVELFMDQQVRVEKITVHNVMLSMGDPEHPLRIPLNIKKEDTEFVLGFLDGWEQRGLHDAVAAKTEYEQSDLYRERY